MIGMPGVEVERFRLGVLLLTIVPEAKEDSETSENIL